MMRRGTIVTLLLAALLILSCGGNKEVAGGSGSVTTNGITGSVIENSQTAAEVSVTLYPVGHIPSDSASLPDSMRLETDSEGAYLFKNIPPGHYNIVAVNDSSSRAALIPDIIVPDSGDTLIQVADAILEETGSLSLPLAALEVTPGGEIWIPGTGIGVLITDAHLASGTLLLENVPEGSYASVQYGEDNMVLSDNILADSVRIAPSVSTTLPTYFSWAYSNTLHINTSPSGAGLTETLIQFPFLLRLTGSNFNFSQADTSGRDLRIAKTDETPLSFEIERWDASNQAAEVWILLDSLHANNPDQSLIFHTGNANATSRSSPVSVFDTALGFAGVWHLAEAGNNLVGGYAESTPNANHGTGWNMNSASTVTGVAGNAQAFDGSSQYISSPLPARIGGDNNFTVSFWVNVSGDSISTGRSWIVSFGRFNFFEYFHFLLRPDSTAQFGVFDTLDSPGSDKQNYFPVPNFGDAWQLVTTTYDSQTKLLSSYINAILQDADTLGYINIAPLGNVNIGLNENWRPNDIDFTGAVDELQMHHQLRSPAWIRMMYENQRPGASFITIQ